MKHQSQLSQWIRAHLLARLLAGSIQFFKLKLVYKASAITDYKEWC
jgi:hypothetical protein